MRRMRCGFAFTIAILLIASVSLAVDYEIKIERPFKVGYRYRLSVTSSDQNDLVMKSGGNVVGSESSLIMIDATADVTVTAVDENGDGIGKSYRIAKFTRTIDGRLSNPFKEGDVIEGVVESGKAVYRLRGTPLKGEDALAMGMFDTLSTDKTTDDEVFGTKDRKKIGDSWPVNSEKMAEELGIRKEDVSGTVTLVGLTEEGGNEFLNILVEAKFRTAPVPPGMTVTKAMASATIKARVPVDTTLSSTAGEYVFEADAVATGRRAPNEPEMTLEVKARRMMTEKSEPLK